MKTIRVREKNAATIMAAIPGSQVVEAPPYTDWGVGDYLIPGRSGETWEDWGDFQDTPPALGMVGLQLPDGMSGKQANKIIETLKSQGLIQ